MSNRCPSCNKFASMELEEDFEEQITETEAKEGAVSIQGEVRMTLRTECCGDEAAGATEEFEVEVDFQHECEDPEYKADINDASPNDEFRGKGRRKTHYYQVELTGKVRCLGCQEEHEWEAVAECQASGFEDLN